MKKLTNKALKDLLTKIENELNNREEFEGEFWTYKLELKKDEILVKIYDDENCNNDYLECEFSVDMAEDIVSIIKSMINYLYENELNDLNSYVKSTTGYNKRHIRSINLWLERGKQEKVDKLVMELSNRYKVSKNKEFEISKFKDIIKDFYNCMTTLSPLWRIESIKEKVFDRCAELSIKNVGISYIDNKLIIMKSDDKATKILDNFDILIDSYCNISATANTIVNRLAKVA